tara:strand:- start:1387 stop:1632 length:246 start_codon:yes stop_codon:yes gene_type:complete
MLRQFIQNNINLTTIVLFLFFFIIFIVSKPQFVFDKNGRPREFGLGYKNKTVVPIWLIIIILAIFSYLLVLYYLNLNKLLF